MERTRELGWVVFGAMMACSSSSNVVGTDAGLDVVTPPHKDASGAPAPDDAGDDSSASQPCNNVALSGSPVAVTRIATPAQSGDGGTVVDGTYVVTAFYVYTGYDGGTGPTSATYRATNVIEAGTFEFVQEFDGGPPLPASGTFTLSGPSVLIGPLCPTRSPSIYTSYTSDGTTITLYAPTAKPPQALVGTKQ
jgi:hypothetical protein